MSLTIVNANRADTSSENAVNNERYRAIYEYSFLFEIYRQSSRYIRFR